MIEPLFIKSPERFRSLGEEARNTWSGDKERVCAIALTSKAVSFVCFFFHLFSETILRIQEWVKPNVYIIYIYIYWIIVILYYNHK